MLVPVPSDFQPLSASMLPKSRLRGVAGTHFNDQRQMSGRLLFVPGLESFVVDEEGRPVAEVPVLPVSGLLRMDSALHQRVLW